jgi:hypothetical protein
MSIEAMKQALEALTYIHAETSQEEDIVIDAAITALRAAIEQAEKPVAWKWKALVNGEFVSNWVLTHSEPPPYATESMPLYAAPRQEQSLKIDPAGCYIRVGEVSEPISVGYDQTSLELCEECGWRAIIPGDGCLVCARQKAKPVAWMYDFLSDNRDEVIRNWVTQSQDDIRRENGFNVRPLYTVPPAAPKPYRRGTYVRCMESDELCRVYTTSIDGGAWVRWPDGSITTYTAEQMGQAFSLEQAAPGKPVAYVDERIHGWPDCFVSMPDPPHTTPLYTEPREWVGLTDEELKLLWEQYGYKSAMCKPFAHAIEAKLKEKNHG